MRCSVHLARPHPAAAGHLDDDTEDGTPRRRLDPLLGVLCCLLDPLLALSAGALTTGDPVTGDAPTVVGASLATAVLVVPALTWRRRAPRPVFGVLWLHALLSVLLLGYRPVLGLAVALYTVAVRERRGLALGALTLALVPVAIDGFLARTSASAPAQAGGAVPAVALGMAAVVLAGAWLAAQPGQWRHRRRLAARRRWEAECREAAAEERSRHAHDLLCIITHCLGAITLQAAGARRVLACHPDRAARALATIETRSAQATGELHRLLGILRASGIAEASSLQLGVALPAGRHATASGDPADEPTHGATDPRADEPTPQPEPGRQLALSDLRPFLDQARAAGVPLRVLTTGAPHHAATGLDLPADPETPPSTVEMRWSDGALELVLATGAPAARDHVPTPRPARAPTARPRHQPRQAPPRSPLAEAVPEPVPQALSESA